MVNYIIWKAKIVNDFGCWSVKVKDYHLGYGMTIKVPMIHTVGMKYLFRVEDLSSTVLMLSSLAANLTAYFIIPDIGKMHKVEQRLTYPHFRRMRRQLSLRLVDLETPELSLFETHDLESVMNLLRITYVFNSGANSSVVMNDTLPKSLKVVSKAVLTIDEKGLKPGTNSCFKVDESTEIGHRIQFNRPFLIFIQDHTNDVPLFLGRVVNPKN